MKLKFRLASGKEELHDLDERARVEDVLTRLGEEDFVFGQPPKSLLQYKGKDAMLCDITSLRPGDVLWAAKRSSTSQTGGHQTSTFSSSSSSVVSKPATTREVIEIADDEEDIAVVSKRPRLIASPPTSSSSSSSLSSSLPNKPMFFQNPIEALGVPQQERLCTASLSSLVSGENLEEAIILNYCVDLDIVQHVLPQLRAVPVALCVGEHGYPFPDADFHACFPQTGSRVIRAKCPPFGTHHSKMFVLFYADGRGVRVIIHTSNLERTNLFMHTEGTWFQDFPLKIPGATAAAAVLSGNDFGPYLTCVLVASGVKEAPGLLSKYDFSSAEVALVATIPKNTAYNTASEIAQNGLGRVRFLMDRERARNPGWAEKIKSWPVVLQGSSLGSQASKISATANWLIDELGRTLGARSRDQVELVVVSKREMLESHFGLEGAQATFFKREHFQVADICRVMRKWTPSNPSLPTRARVLPHFKSYVCYEPAHGREIAWAMMGSHNCTKAAWGSWTSSTRDKLYCLSFELSVMFLPSVLRAAGDRRWSVIRNDWIQIPQRDTFVSDVENLASNEALLPIPFRLPTTRYSFANGDEPFCQDDF